MQLPALLDARALHAEVERITKAGQGTSSGLWLTSLPKAKSGSEAAAQLLALLLKWVQVICAKAGLAIRDWASSFADGQAICLLVSPPFSSQQVLLFSLHFSLQALSGSCCSKGA